MKIQVKLWVEEEGKVLFGDGRQQLLEAVERNGSLAGAARELQMSYRAAWGRLKASEERLGFPLVEKSGTGRRAVHLTTQARDLMKTFDGLSTDAHGHLNRAEKQIGQMLKKYRQAAAE